MKVLLLSLEGDGCGLALKMLEQGHDVGLWLKFKSVQPNYSGMVRKFTKVDQDSLIQDLEAAIAWKPDLAICDMTKLTNVAEQLRSAGIPVLGGYKICDAMEENRFETLQFMAKRGVNIPVTVGFQEDEVDDAIKFVSQAEKSEGYVVKSSRTDKASSFVAQRPEDIAPFMEQYPPQGPFILQQRIDGICEISAEMWFSDGKPIGLVIGGVEQKKFMPGDATHPRGLGPNTGCASNIGWAFRDYKLVDLVFTPQLLDDLRVLHFTGPLSLDNIIGKDSKPYLIEVTPRFGYTALYDMLEYVEADWAEFFAALAAGNKPAFAAKPGFGFSIHTSISPFPQDNEKLLLRGEHIRLKKGLSGHFWPEDAIVMDNELVTAGTSGSIGTVTAYGESVEAAIKLGKERVQLLDVSDLQYRSDAGAQVEGIYKLRKAGYKLP